MKPNDTNNDQHTEFFARVEIPFQKNKEEVWTDLMQKRRAFPQEKSKTHRLAFYWSATATVALLIGVVAFMRFFTVEMYAPAGEHLTKVLPDNSKIHLNAGTLALYHPYWWRFSRVVKLRGEAYFEVTKGNTFAVVSELATTRVLGTSFNVFARGNNYRVHCLTGRVEVKTPNSKKTVLKPNEAVAINQYGDVKPIEKISGQHAISWTNNTFIFTAAPLSVVFEEMERQFDIEIVCENEIKGSYTGNIKRGTSPEQILNVISRPFSLRVVKINQTKFKILY